MDVLICIRMALGRERTEYITGTSEISISIDSRIIGANTLILLRVRPVVCTLEF